MPRTTISLALFLALVTACGGGGDKVTGSFAGVVTGSDAFVGLVSDGDRVLAYVCDGETIGEWFFGDARRDEIDLLSDASARLRVTLTSGTASGTFTTAAGTSLAFSAPAVTEPAGLYRAEQEVEGTAVTVGWVVLPSGERRGLLCGFGGFGCFSPLPPSCSCAGVAGCASAGLGPPPCSCVLQLGVPVCLPPPPLCVGGIGGVVTCF